MDMMGMGGEMDYSPLYAKAKEILAAGMLAELAEDAKEAIGEGEDSGAGGCPHCGATMGMGNPLAKRGLSDYPGEQPEMAPMLPPQLAMRMPAPMPASPMNYSQPSPSPLTGLGM